MAYSDFITINKNFKSSVNLSYDIGNEEKIKNYILTQSLTECIEKYVDNVINSENNASYITGPYGKGKSYLFLVILYIFSKKKNKRIFENFKKRIEIFSSSLPGKLDYIEDNKLYLLPIIINANSGNSLHNSFLTSLRIALFNNGITDNLNIPTSYSLALDYIKRWEKDSNNLDIFSKCKEKLSISLKELKVGLANEDETSLIKFKGLFFCITHGVEFNSFYDENFAKIYFETIKKLNKKFKGFFVVFDEFGAFLDTPNNMIVKDLNQIQNFAEMCKSTDNNNNKNLSLHFALIAHKDLDSYNKNKDLNNAFQTIKGRFQKYDFTRSFEDDFTSILSSIDINDKSKYEKENEKYVWVLKESMKLNLFEKNEYNILLKRAFPFNPIALKGLVVISRSLGQNERTMFSFMESKTSFSFYDFINHTESGLLTLDYIYDYFEEAYTSVKNYDSLFKRTVKALRMCRTDIERSVVKVVSVLHLINDAMVIKVDKEHIALSLENGDKNTKNTIFETISILIEKGILKESLVDKSIEFLPLMSNELNDKIAKTTYHKGSDGLLQFLTEINLQKYIVSNEYNFKYKMTRYFESVFFSLSNLTNVDDFSYLLSEYDSDGLVINLYNDLEEDSKSIIDSIEKKCSHLPIMFNHILKPFSNDFVNKTIILEKISKLLKSGEKFSENDVASLETYKEILKNEVCDFLKIITKIDTNHLCSILENYYTATIVFNNEQVNRNVLTKTTVSSLCVVCDAILLGRSESLFTKNKTSQEYTILKSFENTLATKNAKKLVNLLIDLFKGNDSHHLTFESILNTIKNEHFGIRKGGVPLFIAYSIASVASEVSGTFRTVFLYNGKKEIPLNAQNIFASLQKPSLCYLSFTDVQKDILLCLNDLYSIFVNADEKNELLFKEKLYKVVEGIKSFVYSLAQTILHTTDKDNILSLSRNAIVFKDTFLKDDLNAYDTLFISLTNGFKTDVKHLTEEITKVKQEYSEKLRNFIQNEVLFVINALNKKATSIKGAFDLFYANNKEIDEMIFEQNSKIIFTILKNSSFSDKECINMLSSELLNVTLDDFNSNKKEYFENAITTFVDDVKTYKKNRNNSKNKNIEEEILSPLGETFFNNLHSTFEEYAFALSNKEKVMALEKLLKEVRGI